MIHSFVLNDAINHGTAHERGRAHALIFELGLGMDRLTVDAHQCQVVGQTNRTSRRTRLTPNLHERVRLSPQPANGIANSNRRVQPIVLNALTDSRHLVSFQGHLVRCRDGHHRGRRQRSVLADVHKPLQRCADHNGKPPFDSGKQPIAKHFHQGTKHASRAVGLRAVQ